MGWLEKFFCLSVDEDDYVEFAKGEQVSPNFCRPGPSNTIRKEPWEKHEDAAVLVAYNDSLKEEWDMREDKELDLEKDSPEPPPETRVPLEVPSELPGGFDVFEVECVIGTVHGLAGMTGAHQAKHLMAAFDWGAATAPACGFWDALHLQMLQSDRAIDLKTAEPRLYAYLLGCVALWQKQENAKLAVEPTHKSETTTVDNYDAGFVPPGLVFSRGHEPSCRLARLMIDDGYMFEFLTDTSRDDWQPCGRDEQFDTEFIYRRVPAERQTQSILRGGRGGFVNGPQPEVPAHSAIVGGQNNFVADVVKTFGAKVVKVPAPAPSTLSEHLQKQGNEYLRELLVGVDYGYGDAVLKLMGDNLQLGLEDCEKNLRKHMLKLRERLLEEVQSWFCGNGRLLETGPEIVDCYLSCDRDGEWHLKECDPVTGGTLVREEICSRLAHHIILASDVCNLLQEQKVLCLMNLILRR